MRRRLGRGTMVGVIAMVMVGAIALAAVGAVAEPVSGSQPRSDLSVTFNEADFLARNRIVMTETFDHPFDFDPERRTVSFHGVRFTSKDTAAPYWTVGGVEGADVQCPEVCRLFRRFSDGPDNPQEGIPAAVSFRKGGAVHSFGFMLNPFGFPNQFVISIVEVDGRVTSIALPPDARDTYVGLHSRAGIKKIVIGQPAAESAGATNFAFDQVSRSYIAYSHR